MNGAKGGEPTPKHKRRPRSQVVKVGDRKILASGLDAPFLGDLYYQAMKSSWPAFFGAFAAVFLVVNVIFASVYRLGENPIANAKPGSLKDLFFFSIETLGTVGYGDMHPQTAYGHAVAAVEIFTGMSVIAVVTGLVFARFSRPRARLVFARHMVVGPHEEKQTLMMRMANQRHNMISEASAKLWVLLEAQTAEGERYRRFYELPLERGENPVFVLSWTIFHVIDESSVLFGMGADELEEADAVFIVTFAGLDEAANQRVNARQSFSHQSIRWGHRYADVLGTTKDGMPRIDYGKFHDTQSTPSHQPNAEAAEEGAGSWRGRRDDMDASETI
jgi:inward rectifier potassium channel